MRVGRDDALADLDHRGAAERLVLADRRDVVGQDFLHGAAVRIGGAEKRADIRRAAVQRQLGDVADERLELLVLGDEIGLGVDLDDRALGALDGNADEALGGGAAGLLGGGGETLGAEPVDAGLHVAIVLHQRLAAIHHARAGALAQILGEGGGDFSHRVVP